jgi:CheY-like chemotaxis protein
VVDDQQLLATTLSTILRDAGYETTTAFSGEEAVAIAPSFNPDCLLTDVSMPGIDGIEAAISIQNRLPQCRVLLISGHAATKDLLRAAIANGHNFEVLAKPVPPTDLLAQVSEILATDQLPLATILNVDDNEIHRYAVSQLLSHQGFAVKEAASGAEALELARNQPDAILLDINMPDMDGFEVCRRLKMMPETAQIPIVHVTNACKNDEARQKSLTSGAAEYLMHPVDSDTLFSLLDRLIHGRAATDAATNSSEPEAQIRAS